MKKTITASALAIAGVLLAPSAFAQVYAGGGYSTFSFDTAGEDVTLGAVTARLGYQFNPFFAVEGEASFGVKDDTVMVLATPVDVELDSEFGAFAVGKLPLPFGVDLFGRLGFAAIEVSPSSFISDSDSGEAYGAGLEFTVLGLKARAEYTRYTFGGGVDSAGVSALLKF